MLSLTWVRRVRASTIAVWIMTASLSACSDGEGDASVLDGAVPPGSPVDEPRLDGGLDAGARPDGRVPLGDAAAPDDSKNKPPDADGRPNILFIMADDLGYSDIGAFGGEIRTPNLDRLAREGRILTDHVASTACSPTRAMLISGADPHLVGLGAMAELIWPAQAGKPGHEGYLNRRALSVAELLRDSGYHTYIAGKWHLGLGEERGPNAWGFESSFVLSEGAAGHFAPDPKRLTLADLQVTYRENGVQTTVPDDFFSTDYYTDKLLEYMAAHERDGKPFFAFAAYTAPHVPLQAPDAFIDRYRGVYDVGYEAIRQKRIERQKALGILPPDAMPSALAATIDNPDWNALPPQRKRVEARVMEVYAAMVENLDHNVGRLIAYLEQTKQYDHTFVFFQSDNGPEGNATFLNDQNSDNSFENIGRRYSNVASGKRWAEVSATPHRAWKAYMTQGGIAVPAIARLPRTGAARAAFAGITHTTDLAPTFLELARIPRPSASHRGREVAPMTGRSLLPGLSGMAPSVHPPGTLFADELNGGRYARRDKWKLLWYQPPLTAGQWVLLDLANDPSETRDVSSANPEVAQALREGWLDYAKRVGVVLPGGGAL